MPNQKPEPRRRPAITDDIVCGLHLLLTRRDDHLECHRPLMEKAARWIETSHEIYLDKLRMQNPSASRYQVWMLDEKRGKQCIIYAHDSPKAIGREVQRISRQGIAVKIYEHDEPRAICKLGNDWVLSPYVDFSEVEDNQPSSQ